MKLLTKEIEKGLPKLYSTENVPLEDKVAVCKFFNPNGRSTWYVFEGQRQDDGDVLFFGFVVGEQDPSCDEAGYFSLRELESLRTRFGLGIERDLYFSPKKFSEIAR